MWRIYLGKVVQGEATLAAIENVLFLVEERSRLNLVGLCPKYS